MTAHPSLPILFLKTYINGNSGYSVRELNGNEYVVAGGTDFYYNFHWFNMSETARRIRILVGHVSGLPSTQKYEPKQIFTQRIDRLLEFGTITRRADMLVLKRGPLVWATRVIFFWRKIFYPED